MESNKIVRRGMPLDKESLIKIFFMYNLVFFISDKKLWIEIKRNNIMFIYHLY